MKTYEVEVNGQVYLVRLKEVTENSSLETKTNDLKHPTISTDKQVSEPKVQSETHPPQQEGETVSAPMAGVILAINKQVGDSVKKGDVLIILEAMKMENEILAPNDGVVKAVHVAVNQSVESNQPLLVI